MKILVTGGAGFIGSHIVDLLVKSNYEVCIIDNLNNGNIENVNSKVKFYKCNLLSSQVLDIFKIEKPQVIIHEAASISVSGSIKILLKTQKIILLER